tara:strand:- start:2568 stop:2870 length:303 start_codon:yes stop_codon:yes gene_type:complete
MGIKYKVPLSEAYDIEIYVEVGGEEWKDVVFNLHVAEDWTHLDPRNPTYINAELNIFMVNNLIKALELAKKDYNYYLENGKEDYYNYRRHVLRKKKINKS